MRDVWAANVAAKKHLFKISNADIAEKYGCCPQYIGQLLNGIRKTEGAQEHIEEIVEEIIKERRL